MLLKTLTIENFRGIEKLSLDLDRTTVLIGENNSGKTSVLEALSLGLGKGHFRRGSPFSDYDHHLPTKDSVPTDAPPITLTLVFREEADAKWPDSITQALDKAVQVQSSGLQELRLRMTSTCNKTTKEFELGWDFLDLNDQPLVSARNARLLPELQQFVPVFFLTAIRDAGQQFQPRSPFWGAFVRDLQLDDASKASLEKQIEGINKAVLDAHKPFEEIRTRLQAAAQFVPLDKTDGVSIEAIPLRVFDLLSRTQVKLAAASGARLPLAQHGAGTQSLAVMFLFEAFLNAKLTEAYDKDCEPLLALEEPEAHLHPSAVRALWSTLERLRGQKIVATHSGDLLSAVPVTALRRLARKKGKLHVFQLLPGSLTADDLDKIAYNIRSRRGSLLFARCWLLVEGQTEYWLTPEAARHLGKDLEQEGVCVIEFAQWKLDPLIKVASALGIEWHVLTDGDAKGNEYVQKAKGFLGTDAEADRITQLGSKVERELWNVGYAQVYESATSQNSRKAHVVSKPSDPTYPDEVIEAALSLNSKPQLALAIVEALLKPGSPGLPAKIEGAIRKAIELAQR